MKAAALYYRRLDAGLSPHRLGFDPGTFHVKFVVNKVTLGEAFLRALRFFPVSIIPPTLLLIFILQQNSTCPD